MVNPQINRRVILLGCLLWCASFFGEGLGGQPYSTIGIFVSPVLTVVGVFFWLRHYRATRGHYPKLKTIRENTTNFGGQYTLNFDFLINHVLEFWTFCILFWMGLAFVVCLAFRGSDAFEATKSYCHSNQEILSQTGEIKYFGVFVIGNISYDFKTMSGDANLSFMIVGKNGNFKADSELVKHNGVWLVKNLAIR